MIRGRGRGRPRQTLKTTETDVPKILKEKEVVKEVAKETRKQYEKNEEVKVDLIRCPTCDSSNTICFGTTAFPGRTMMLDGKMIEGIRIQRRTCNGCKRNFVVKIPLY